MLQYSVIIVVFIATYHYQISLCNAVSTNINITEILEIELFAEFLYLQTFNVQSVRSNIHFEVVNLPRTFDRITTLEGINDNQFYFKALKSSILKINNVYKKFQRYLNNAITYNELTNFIQSIIFNKKTNLFAIITKMRRLVCDNCMEELGFPFANLWKVSAGNTSINKF